jgi:hypothetical protein
LARIAGSSRLNEVRKKNRSPSVAGLRPQIQATSSARSGRRRKRVGSLVRLRVRDRREHEVAVAHRHRRAGVQLERDLSASGCFGRSIGHLDERHAVDGVRESRSNRADHVLVPSGLDRRLQRSAIAEIGRGGLRAVGAERDPLATPRDDAAALLLIEDAGVVGAGFEIGLVARHREVAEVAASVLDAGVAAVDRELEAQFEVVERAVADQVGVAFAGRLFGGAADDHAVLDRPEAWVAGPARERGAVEETDRGRRRIGVGGEGEGKSREREGDRGSMHARNVAVAAASSRRCRDRGRASRRFGNCSPRRRPTPLGSRGCPIHRSTP